MWISLAHVVLGACFLSFLWRGHELIGKSRNSKRFFVVAFCPSAGAEYGKLDNHGPVCQLIFD